MRLDGWRNSPCTLAPWRSSTKPTLRTRPAPSWGRIARRTTCGCQKQPRCELLYGRLPVTLAPTVRHQSAVTRRPSATSCTSSPATAARTPGGLACRRRARRALDRTTGRDLREQGARRHSPPARRGSSRSGGRDPLARNCAPRSRREATSLRGIRRRRVLDRRSDPRNLRVPGEHASRDPRAAAGGSRSTGSAAIPDLELDLEVFWRALPSYDRPQRLAPGVRSIRIARP